MKSRNLSAINTIIANRQISTGATGLIGGDYLHIISQKHRDWNVAALVRDPVKARIVKEHYPFVEIVLGDLDDTQVLEAESEKADIVLSMLSFNLSLSLDATLTFF